jgi:TonB family protein
VPFFVLASTLTASAQAPATAAWRTGTATILFDGAALERWTAEQVGPNARFGPDSLPDIVDRAMRLTARPGWTRTKDVFRNFRLVFAYRIAERGTAAVYYRTWPRLDEKGRPVNGSVFTLPAGDEEWHQVLVDCRDGSAYITIDGNVAAYGNDLTNSAGYIGLRVESGRLDVRDVTLTPLTNTTRILAGNRNTPGSGIQNPRLLQEVKPQFTADAMRERIQGAVWIEAEVLEDGTVGDVLVVNSLDPVFGLDDEAVRAAKSWRFQPGTLDGKPVPVVVTIELTFTLK